MNSADIDTDEINKAWEQVMSLKDTDLNARMLYVAGTGTDEEVFQLLEMLRKPQ